MNGGDIDCALDKRFAFIDAMSSAVSLSVQVIELAVIATCGNLGQSGLEFSIVIAALSSIFFLSIGTLLAQILGYARTLLLGVAMKALAHITLLFAVLLATQGAIVCAWLLITAEAVMSAIAIAGMIASYRPSYGLWYQLQSGKSVDLMQTFAYSKILRGIGPIIIWALAFVFVKAFAKTSPEISIPTILLLIATALRIIQFMLYKQDLHLVFDLDKQTVIAKSHKSSIVEHIKLGIGKAIFSLKLVFKNHSQYALYYMYGDIFFLIMVTYLLGEISRVSMYQGQDRSTVIMLGMLAGLLVHLSSSFIGAKYYPVLLNWAKLRLFCAIAMITSILCSVVFVYRDDFFSILALSIITLMFQLIGVGIVRYISTSFMRISKTETQSIFFAVAETLSCVLWLIVMLILAMFDNHAMGICLMVILFAIVGAKFFWSARGLDNSGLLESGE